MKQLLVAGLLTLAAIVLDSAVGNAQVLTKTTVPLQTQSLPLVTQPASLSQVQFRSGQPFKPYTAEQLNGIVGPLEARPRVKAPPAQGSPASLLQKFSASDPKPASIDPIDFFKPQGLNGGVKVPLQ